MCGLVTYDLFEIMEEFSDFKNLYNEEEIEALKEVHELIREDVFLDIVYGAKSKMHHQDWLKAVVLSGSFIFHQKHLRAMVIEKAGLDFRPTQEGGQEKDNKISE